MASEQFAGISRCRIQRNCCHTKRKREGILRQAALSLLLGFMWHAFMSPSDRSYFPIALPPGNEAAGALGKTSSPFQLALAFQELRVGETDSFNDKWMGYLAQASLQELTEATEQPEPGQQIRGPSR